MSKIIVVGGSFGAVNALKVILANLPDDFPAAVLIVTHIGSHSSLLPEILEPISPLPVRFATDGEPIIAGRVLLAPPDEHLTVVTVDGRFFARLVHGPKENHSRPAIDPLFRSAATTFGVNTIGVLLTGYLDDGTVGLQAVKACGGIAIVQDPAQAEAPDMPASALKYVDVDRRLSVAEIGQALVELASASTPASGTHQGDVPVSAPDWIDVENRIVATDSDMDDLEQIGTPSSFTCPECHGALWEISHSNPIRYRCHTGHAYTSKVLEALQSNAVEEAVWGAIRALHEQESLLTKMGEKSLQFGRKEAAAEYQAKAAQVQKYSKALRDVIATKALVVNRKAT